jgi:hypothetical protein
VRSAKCDASNSPTINFNKRRISSGVLRAAMSGSYDARTCSQFGRENRSRKVVAQVGPCLPEHFHLLARKIDVHLSRYRERTRASFEINDADAAVIEVEDLLAVGRELRPVFVAPTSTSIASRRSDRATVRRVNTVEIRLVDGAARS